MVPFDEVKELMDRMVKTTILQPAEKHELLKDENKPPLDTNLIMDTRHRMIRENLLAPTKISMLDETEMLLMDAEAKELYVKKEQQFLENQLKKFEKELYSTRPKFRGPYTCSRKCLANSDDEHFWRTPGRIKAKSLTDKNRKEDDVKRARSTRKDKEKCNINSTSDSISKTSEEIAEATYCGNIKVTIKDKPVLESLNNLQTLKIFFETLRQNAKEERRLRDITTKIQENLAFRRQQRFFQIWKTRVESVKNLAQKRKAERENSDEKKIETFINIITERQKELKSKKLLLNPSSAALNTADDSEEKRVSSKQIIMESPAQRRLNAQKKIIQNQKMRLAEQNKIIEELRLKQVQEEICKTAKETLYITKEMLQCCDKKTRRTLIQLMRQAGHSDKTLTPEKQISSSPQFLKRMEARAESRKERFRKAEEIRRKKLEEQKRKEETLRKEEEQKRKRLQQEALRETRRLREEQKQSQIRERERGERLNKMAEQFYRKYLLRHYVIEPLMALVEMKNNHIKKAQNYYKQKLLRKVFTSWKMEVENQYEIKLELVKSMYNRNLLWGVFKNWKQLYIETSRKNQVAKDFYDMRLQDKCFKLWRMRSLQYKIKRLENLELALEHYNKKLKVKYFQKWKKFPEIAKWIKESEKIRDKWRRLVQEVIPDFSPT